MVAPPGPLALPRVFARAHDRSHHVAGRVPMTVPSCLVLLCVGCVGCALVHRHGPSSEQRATSSYKTVLRLDSSQRSRSQEDFPPYSAGATASSSTPLRQSPLSHPARVPCLHLAAGRSAAAQTHALSALSNLIIKRATRSRPSARAAPRSERKAVRTGQPRSACSYNLFTNAPTNTSSTH